VIVFAVEENSNRILEATREKLMKGPIPISPYVCPRATDFSKPEYIRIVEQTGKEKSV